MTRRLTALNERIRDTGIGIAPEDLTRIFEPFTQTVAGRKFQEGTLCEGAERVV